MKYFQIQTIFIPVFRSRESALCIYLQGLRKNIKKDINYILSKRSNSNFQFSISLNHSSFSLRTNIHDHLLYTVVFS